jgi:hypothetical protein
LSDDLAVVENIPKSYLFSIKEVLLENNFMENRSLLFFVENIQIRKSEKQMKNPEAFCTGGDIPN